MRKFIITVFSICLTFVAFAQTDPAAKALLDKVSKKYDSYKTIQSDFNFSAQQAEGEAYTDQGKMALDKSKNRFNIQLSEQDLISDGKTTWSILKNDKEVQLTTADNTGESIGPNNLFTFYKKGFKYVSMPDERIGQETLKVVELSPLDTKKNYFKIKLRINKNMHIHDVLIFDKSGARYTYTIKTLYVNQSIPADKFTFSSTIYKNYEMVDLR